MGRRVVTLAVVGLLLTSGCLGLLPADATRFEADPVGLSEAATGETGYELTNRTRTRTERTVTGGEVVVVNREARYARAVNRSGIDAAGAARFRLLATPQVTVLGQGPFNPVANFSNRDLAERVAAGSDRLVDLRPAGNRTAAMLGAETRVSTFRATATVAGGRGVAVLVHATKATHGDDFVIAIAVHPAALAGETATVDRLLGGVEHAGAD